MKLSAVILSRNEEDHIEKTIKSLPFCNEIILIDSYSSDGTTEIARKRKAIVFERELDSDFSAQRNYGFEKAKGEWVLFIDADEIVSKELARDIQKTINNNPRNSTYYIKRRDFWWGKELKYGELRKVRTQGLVRLVKKDSGEWQGLVHETFVARGSIGSFEGFIDHYPHKRLSEFIADINFYSSLRARELVKQKKGVSILSIILYPLGKFLTTYFLKFGFLDGVQGFVYSFLMSFHSFLVRTKQYQYSKF